MRLAAVTMLVLYWYDLYSSTPMLMRFISVPRQETEGTMQSFFQLSVFNAGLHSHPSSLSPPPFPPSLLLSNSTRCRFRFLHTQRRPTHPSYPSKSISRRFPDFLAPVQYNHHVMSSRKHRFSSDASAP